MPPLDRRGRRAARVPTVSGEKPTLNMGLRTTLYTRSVPRGDIAPYRTSGGFSFRRRILGRPKSIYFPFMCSPRASRSPAGHLEVSSASVVSRIPQGSFLKRPTPPALFQFLQCSPPMRSGLAHCDGVDFRLGPLLRLEPPGIMTTLGRRRLPEAALCGCRLSGVEILRKSEEPHHISAVLV
jgi:hypothetical protein